MTTLHALLTHRARSAPDFVAYRFIDPDADGLVVGSTRTWSGLHKAACGWTGALQGVPAGERALLVFPEGLEFLDALFGCLMAGVVAVPLHPPDPGRLARTLPRVRSVTEDASPSVVLGPADVCDLLDGPAAELPRLHGPSTPVEPRHDTALAYLQYTSGSTSEPKGVRIGHRHLLHQLADFDTGYAHDGGTLVSWLPATHDLGLVYGRLMGLFRGIHTVAIAPEHFIRRPRIWLEALTTFGGTHSPSPNFGFEYAARRVKDTGGLDLSSVRVLLNGAEAIRSRSEAAFIERFSPVGLHPHAVTHAMGMSEATAKIVTEPIGRAARFITVDPDALADNRVVERPTGIEVASNGSTVLDTEVRIVDPNTHHDLGSNRVGELWVRGTTVAEGYWNRPELSRATFEAQTSAGDGPFLRTGDLGFLHDGELFLVGRLKDLIILRGANHHPSDLEWAIDGAHPALRPNAAVAFAIASDDGDQVGVAAEIRDVNAARAVVDAIRRALAGLEIQVHRIDLLDVGQLPKTTSGKLRRNATRDALESGELSVLHQWRPTPTSGEHSVRALLAARIGLEPHDVPTDVPFRELGLDSVTAVEFVEDVGQLVGRAIPVTWLWDHPTVEALEAALKPPSPTARPRSVEEMTEAEAEAALLAELEDL